MQFAISYICFTVIYINRIIWQTEFKHLAMILQLLTQRLYMYETKVPTTSIQIVLWIGGRR